MPIAYEEQVTMRVSQGMRMRSQGEPLEITWKIGARPLAARRVNTAALCEERTAVNDLKCCNDA